MIDFTRHLSGIFNGAGIRIDRATYNIWRENRQLKRMGVPTEVIRANTQFKDIHKGKRCFIVGNAPSINTQDLSLLGDEYVFTMNYIYKNPGYPLMKSNYHFFTDPGCFVAGKYTNSDFSAIGTPGNMPTCFFMANTGYTYAKQAGLDKTMDIHYLFDFVPFDKPFAVRGDLSRGVTSFSNVVQTAILVAVYMGFSEIYLIGCDCTGIITNIEVLENKEKVHGYAYEFTKAEQEKLKKAYSSRIKIKDTFLSWTRTFEGYERLADYCTQHSVKLINATNGGILDILPRVNYESLFNN